MMNNGGIVYFLGIGGIGMSALARYFKAQGFEVAGYDRTCSPLTQNLENEGIKIHYSDNPSLIPENIDFVVMTPAIPANLQELNVLRSRNVKIVKRAEVLGMLSRRCKTLAVAGTHGKTTTTALVTHIMMTAGRKISSFIGGISRNINSNVVIGAADDDFLVVEADEFDHSFLQLSPFASIVTSIDADHLDIYGDYQHLTESFNEFVDKNSDEGIVIYHENLPIKMTKKHLTYGLENANVVARNIQIVNGLTEFEIMTSDDDVFNLHGEKFVMPLYGNHNVQNALAAVMICAFSGVDVATIKEALLTFKGVQRRFDIRVRDEKHVYVDDYAHHPEEIKAALTAARKVFPDKELTVVFQPHLFSRTRDFMDGFAESLSIADRVILLDIYPARELPIEGVTSSALLEKITSRDKMLCTKDNLVSTVKGIDPELIMTMGAGDIDRFVPVFESLFTKNDV
ncbi:MAG: UDP-N-acetylmuramate--L-alanine ligase [Bacteroidales bacterium]|nr:UDP-N-acetylmuramate--L-alanine ligase [Bacteroidales bacterium]